jgi:predicted phage terminase large subunit-like protein
MAALQYVDVPGYSAIMFRRTFADLALPGALMDRAAEWLGGTDAQWNTQEKRWTFPSGASLSFGYLDTKLNHYRYQSAEFQFCAFDELTQFEESQYRYLFSRLRRLKDSQVPIRMRAASNPGGIGHSWVKQRFLIEGQKNNRPFIPSRLTDNPSLDANEYKLALAELDPLTRQQLLNGDWSAREAGGKFRREWFEIVDAAPADAKRVRYWDLASTEPSATNTDPDWTVGCKVCRDRKTGIFYVEDVQRVRRRPQGVEALIVQTAELDGRPVPIYIEEEGGASGKAILDYYIRVLAGYTLRGDKPTGDKGLRANPVSSQAEAGNVKLVRGPWINDFLDELDAFTGEGDAHDDQVDALSGACGQLIGAKHHGIHL